MGFDYGLKTGLRFPRPELGTKAGFPPLADPLQVETLSKAQSAASKLADHAIDIIA